MTSLTELEKAFAESKQRYRTLFENSLDGIVVTDRDGQFIDANEVALSLFAITKGELRRMNIAHLWDEPNELCRLMEDLASRGCVQKQEQRLLRKGGSAFDALVTLSRLLDGEGCVIGYQCLVRDVSEKKGFEVQLQQAHKMEAIGTLAGGIAHDFNNLLMGIQGHVSLLELSAELSGECAQHLRGIEEQVDRAADLTRCLLGFARGGKYEVKPTDMNELLKKSAEMFGRTRKEISIHRRSQKGLWPVEVDRGQIEQVLLNLFVNAWQAMPEGGTLFLTTENLICSEDDDRPVFLKAGKYVKITVRDTGVGMDEATKERIFEPFFTTKERSSGTGLGLASAYGIIKNHGGFIDVISRKGEGSSFMIYLPASNAQIVQVPESPATKKESGTGTILLVDDEKQVIEVVSAMVKALGYHVVTAATGAEAVDIFAREREGIDLVILDCIMPGMSGAEVYEALKRIDPEVKVLVSSGYGADSLAGGLMERGCRGFIQKPFSLRKVSEAIRETLEGTLRKGGPRRERADYVTDMVWV